MRLIDADELEKWMNERMRSLRAAYGYHDDYTDGFEECMEAVENAETIDPETLRPMGRWEPRTDVVGFVRCSVCHDCNVYDDWADGKKWNYCPNCGAKMEE